MQLTTEPSTPLLPRFNIAPTQNAPIVRGLEGGGRELVPMRWGLVPSWAPDLALGSRMINARCETVASKPAFRAAFKARRCLVPISGFYEWEARGAGAPKQPWYIHMAHAPGFALAGLWERWSPREGPAVESFTIVTTSANELVAKFHERMPVILAQSDFARWIDIRERDAAKLQALLVPYSAAEMAAYRVSTLVNRATIDDPRCMAPLQD
jgi:putative SOS response-associated peptidase YedK